MERENPLPFMENSIKNFHFVFLNPSLTEAQLQLTELHQTWGFLTLLD